jgi:hypothetical protein
VYALLTEEQKLVVVALEPSDMPRRTNALQAVVVAVPSADLGGLGVVVGHRHQVAVLSTVSPFEAPVRVAAVLPATAQRTAATAQHSCSSTAILPCQHKSLEQHQEALPHSTRLAIFAVRSAVAQLEGVLASSSLPPADACFLPTSQPARSALAPLHYTNEPEGLAKEASRSG